MLILKWVVVYLRWRKLIMNDKRYLITCMGDTDPIRNYHDGSILHICRYYRPERIHIIHSERSQLKHEKMVNSILSIDTNYRPFIEQSKNVILDSKVSSFDEVYSFLDNEINQLIGNQELSGIELCLNLSSGTPQMKSALYTLNRIKDYEFRAIQVKTPTDSSNEGTKHDSNEDLGLLIEYNEDDGSEEKNRCVEDKSENLMVSLITRNLKDRIMKYDYSDAVQLLESVHYHPLKQILLPQLREIDKNIKNQNTPEDFLKKSAKYPYPLRFFIHTYMITEIKFNRKELAEALIRVSSITEFIIKRYLMKNFENQFNDKVDKFKYANKDELLTWKEICEFIEKNVSKENVNEILKKLTGIRDVRNNVAHNLQKIDDSFDFSHVKSLLKSLKTFAVEEFQIDPKLFNYYKEKNHQLLDKF